MEPGFPPMMERSPAYSHILMAGGIGGATADLLMHSLDTVKTRQQGALYTDKYRGMVRSYLTIFREEGLFHGLYSGVCPMLLGSLPATALFFSSYEFSKRHLMDTYHVPETLSFLLAGFVGDLFASVVYVPSEVLKTRLQLQGRYNNKYFKSDYNYPSFRGAIKQIAKEEGPRTFFFGYRATVLRDIPFSGLQLLFYEKLRQGVQKYSGKKDIGVRYELIIGSLAGAGAGFLTTPLDLAKTRLQTMVRPTGVSDNIKSGRYFYGQMENSLGSSASSTRKQTIGISKVLSSLYRKEGAMGLFKGVGPRVFWTSSQSSLMFVFYESIIRLFKQKEAQSMLD
ncbi:ATP-Mg/Pi carrier [Schizosaccharomyces cryophilus OY26]|uniref:ATP-Mg/Pi carrier n=1 Tax=Schizosaccharomyces cryophilus (strain OY26 / ATCC MYA-4695 / CBS 11777 / NBRC 106824 / NRRL Y48691) TaxID=653667 RepID=S9W1W8_SCHCR|nr:ATP-Mg/Pi carrier [Schizosaccharomyces cryophilus OY26]EPY52025.1 ATP-Mg/Pi carrier [Schizosaccharomyces cryophilus OY26]